MPRLEVSKEAKRLLDEYRTVRGLSYSRAIGRLLGIELPNRGECLRHAWEALKAQPKVEPRQ